MLRVQIFMICITSIASALLFLDDNNPHFKGHDAPISLGVVVGAFMFGIGMQIGDGCGSGSCTNAGIALSLQQQSNRLYAIITILAFIAASTLGAFHFEFWDQFEFFELNFITQFGIFPAITFQVGFLLIMALVVYRIEYCSFGKVQSWWNPNENSSYQALNVTRRRNIPLIWAGILVPVASILIFWQRGSPWGVTSAFALWGSKSLVLVTDVEMWYYWKKKRLMSIWYDHESVMNISLILTTAIISSVTTINNPCKEKKTRNILGAIIGGSFMGYGARIAHGCNIGAFYGGIISYSLLGWVWILCAYPGMMLGCRLRPFFNI